MNELIKKILMSKSVRSSAMLVAFVVTAMDAGMPWGD